MPAIASSAYRAIFAAAPPHIKHHATLDGKSIRVGGPVLSAYSASWLTSLLTNPGTKDYVDFLSYHQYMYGTNALPVQWDTYNGNESLYELTQDPSKGPVGLYNKVVGPSCGGRRETEHPYLPH